MAGLFLEQHQSTMVTTVSHLSRWTVSLLRKQTSLAIHRTTLLSPL